MRSINGSLLLVTRRCVNALLCLLSVATGALANLDPQAFRNPPASSRPLTWMHMMNGNMSADGIARDMQALADAGVGGALLFSLGRNTTRGPVEFLSPEFERVVATAAVDLGKVHVLAEVTLNGRSCGTLWYPPYEVDVAQAVRPGHNELEIRVTNLWPNRIIADEALPPDVEWKGRALADWPDWLKEGRARPPTGRVAFFTWRHWQKDDPLLPSGLVGPVLLRGGTRAEFTPRSP